MKDLDVRDLIQTKTQQTAEGLSAYLDILGRARSIADTDRADAEQTRNRSVATLFFENSTRTRLSFELAAKRLGMLTLNMDVARSSAEKGESLRDTIRTIDAMGVDAIVIRHADDEAAQLAADAARAPVINAGSGITAHPTQALLDVLTIARLVVPDARIDQDLLSGVRLTILGDINHSRVAGSLAPLASALGAHVTVAGPEGYVDESRASALCADRVSHDLADAIAPGGDPVDIVYTLRIQFERHIDQHRSRSELITEYATSFGLSADRFDSIAPNAYLMHPGPVNRGVELEDSAMALKRCLIQQQVTHGVWLRMAALQHCIRMGREQVI